MAITLDGTTGITTPDIDSTDGLTVDGQAIIGDGVVGSSNLTNLTSGTPPQLVAGWSVPAITWSPNSSTEAVFTRDGHTQVDILAGANNLSTLNFSDPDDEDVGQLSYDHSTDAMRFRTNNTERMRINSAGNVLVGKTAASTTGAGIYMNPLGYMPITRAGTSGATYIHIVNDNGTIGSITGSGSTTSFNTSSDYRLKTDAQPMTGASARVQVLKPVNFEWISTGERVDGFLAHEAQEVVPEAVSGAKDAMRDEEYEVTPAVLDEDGNVVTEAVMGTRSVPDYQGIDQSKLVPLLTAALQEALTEIADLKARVTALETV